MYSNYHEVQAILPENVTIGSTNLGTPTPGRSGSGSSRSNITIPECNRYLSFADSQIDAKLRPFYVMPLRRIKLHEVTVVQDITHGDNIVVSVEDSGVFTQWDLVRIQNNYQMEYSNVTDTPSITTIKLDHVINNYSASADATLISIVKFPDPIPLISARLAASFLMDRLYVATNSPDISTYGAKMRTISNNALDDIIKGVILLTGQDMTGKRFVRGSLLDAFSTGVEITKGEEKEV